MKIPEYLDRDNYLQNPIIRRFFKDKNIKFADNRSAYIKNLEEYSDASAENENEVKKWLLKIVKEGSKEICYRKISGVDKNHRNPVWVDEKIKSKYPDCPMQNILEYKNTKERKLIEYSIIKDTSGNVTRINFTFSKLMLYGKVGNFGEETVFPVFIELYLNHGMIISRAKAKSTIYNYSRDDEFLISEERIQTMDYAVSVIDEVIGVLGLNAEKDKKIVENRNSKMLYELYQKYSFTPKDVDKKVENMVKYNRDYVDEVFKRLNLDIKNKPRALMDIKIFVEKYISINGDNEDLFKDREAYLIKVATDDEIELTKIDTASYHAVPLQCTEAFFDSKKSIVKSKKCNKLNLIFRRTNDLYLKNTPLIIQFGTNKGYGYFKTMQYAEEADIQNVLQTIFRYY